MSLQHAGGAAKILQCRGTRPPKDELEKQLLKALRGPVTVQAMFLPEDCYTPSQWGSIASGFSEPEHTADDKVLKQLAATTRLFQRTRSILSSSPIISQDVARTVQSALTLQRTLDLESTITESHLNEACARLLLNIKNLDLKFAHARRAHSHGLLLTMRIQTNSMLAALHPPWFETLQLQNSILCHELCELAEVECTRHRPLGSSWIMTAMVAAAGCVPAQDRLRVDRILASYAADMAEAWTPERFAKVRWASEYLSCRNLRPVEMLPG